MLADQGEARQRVIENDAVFPRDNIVATRAITPKLAFVLVVIDVAPDALDRKFYGVRWLLVAGCAYKRLMSARQRKPRHLIVIETAVFPVAAVVAARAVRAVSPLVNIIGRVTGDAHPGRFADRVSRAVTCGATRTGMLAEQRKTRVTVVVERGALPVGRVMATGAVRAPSALMNIVFGMAAVALGRRPVPALTGMAAEARGGSMLADEGVPRAGMIERQRLFPVVDAMTALTVLAEPTAMRILFGMTACARCWRPAIVRIVAMASSTSCSCVSPGQGVVGQAVVKTSAFELHQTEGAAPMVAMTSLACLAPRARLAVKPGASLNIRCNPAVTA